MNIIYGVKQLPQKFPGSMMTIGNFDGIHLGHQELIQRVVEHARDRKLPSVVMTFEPHPVKFLYPERPFRRLFSFEDQASQIAKLGIDNLIVEPFSREFSLLSPERFLQEFVVTPFAPERLVVGYDFSFGLGKQGSLDLLQKKSTDFGFLLEIVPPVQVENQVVSSSLIRKALSHGDVALVARLLGRRFYLEGIVEKGVGRGKKIGIPTANLSTSAESLPELGVYTAWAVQGETTAMAVVNIGHNPTFGANGAVSVEAHILDFTKEIYGENLRLEFVDRLRAEQKFPSAQELVAQIKKDIEQGRSLLKRESF